MTEFEHSVVVHASPEAVFSFVSDIQNLPQYLPKVDESDFDGYLRVDKTDYVMEWGSDGELAYSGWLEVEEMEENMCEITVHLSFQPRAVQSVAGNVKPGETDALIQENLEAAMMSVQNIVEGRAQSAERGTIA